jgi:hypothetical protein
VLEVSYNWDTAHSLPSRIAVLIILSRDIRLLQENGILKSNHVKQGLILTEPRSVEMTPG